MPNSGGTVDLPRRPDSHVLDTKAQRKFQGLIPPAWVVETPKADYGIDAFLTPFIEGRPIGDMIAVQLKGTAKADAQSDSIGVQLAASTASYLLQVRFPVWLVVYDEKMDECYYLDLKAALIARTATMGARWQAQQELVVQVPRLNRLTAQSCEAWLMANLHPLAAPPGFIRAEAEWTRRLMAAVLPVLCRGPATLDALLACVAATEIRIRSAELPATLSERALVEEAGGKWMLAEPSVAALMEVVELDAPEAVLSLAAAGWFEGIDAEDAGRAVAFAVANKRATTATLEALWPALKRGVHPLCSTSVNAGTGGLPHPGRGTRHVYYNLALFQRGSFRR
jgi:hypothetical protein